MRISDYVKRDLEFRIRSGSELPEKLTLGAIAEMYEVSATPVRLALEELVAEKLIIKQENGRLKLNAPRRKRRADAPPAHPTEPRREMRREDKPSVLADQESEARSRQI